MPRAPNKLQKGARPLGLAPFAFFILFFAGCITLRTTEVVFEDPRLRLGIVQTDPTESEKSGVVLRLRHSSQAEHFHEEHRIYARIKNGKGIRLDIITDRTDTASVGSRSDSYLLLSKTTFQGQKGELLEEKELTTRGEILRLNRSYHRSKIGNFQIISWHRTPIFSEEPVTIGERWNYEEKMEVRMKSFWIKEIDPKPYEMKAASTLEGFALVQGKRTAVIQTKTRQTKREHFKVLFKEILFDIHSNIQETIYLDYSTGTVLARVTQTQSYTEGIKPPLSDTGQSQSFGYPVTLK